MRRALSPAQPRGSLLTALGGHEASLGVQERAAIGDTRAQINRAMIVCLTNHKNLSNACGWDGPDVEYVQ